MAWIFWEGRQTSSTPLVGCCSARHSILAFSSSSAAIGVKSFSIVFITALSIGFVMSIQFGYGLERFGGKIYVPRVVGLSIMRELGPVMTCLMLAGRVGSGIAAELDR
ncbi:MAG: ABC transporter permease [Bdellovibrionota bacterium]